MIQTKSKEFFKFFLLQFTKQLIEHSATSEVIKLKNILKEKANEEKREAKKREEIISKGEKFPLISKKRAIPINNKIAFKPLLSILRIPEPKFPPQLQYLKPIPTSTQIELGKLNPLIKDPTVRVIECNGADENLLVGGIMGKRKTDIILTKQEIMQIINKFSETAKIPAQEGIFKVAVGTLILSAIISEIVDSKFIIRKMRYAPNFRGKFL